MKKTFIYDVTELVALMEEYSGAHFEPTLETEVHPMGHEETIVYVELGMSLDIFEMDEVYYNTENKRYFMFVSTLLYHLKNKLRDKKEVEVIEKLPKIAAAII